MAFSSRIARFVAPPTALRRVAATLVFSSVLSFSTLVEAQSASEKAAAEALFDEGVSLLKAGKYEQACKKLESSQRIEPGIGTLLYLGECYKKVGRTASAWATFREAASKAEAAGESGRAKAGMDRADEIEPELSKVAFLVAEENQGIEGLVVEQAGLAVGRAVWGTPVPVDPGEIKVTARAPGYEPFEISVEVKKGPAAIEVTIPPLVKGEGEPLVESPEEAPAAATQPAPADEEPGQQPGQGQRIAGLVIGGVGVVGMGVGGVFGVIAMNKEGSAKDVCTGTVCDPNENGVELTEQAQSAALVSTIGFAAGGALLAGGLVLYFTAPSTRESARLTVSPTVGGASVSWGARF